MTLILLSSILPKGFCYPKGTTLSFIPLPKTGPGTWMNQGSVTHYLPSQKIGRNTWMATRRTRDFSLRWWKARKGQIFLLNNRSNLDMHCFSRCFSHSFVLSHSCAFCSLSLFGSLAVPQNSSQWWTVCSVWKDPSFIKPLLSVKKIKCSSGPHQLEPSLPLLTVSLFDSLCHTPTFQSTALLQSLTVALQAVTLFLPFFLNSAYQHQILNEFFCPFQGVRLISDGLKSDLGSGGGLAGVWCDSHQ